MTFDVNYRLHSIVYLRKKTVSLSIWNIKIIRFERISFSSNKYYSLKERHVIQINITKKKKKLILPYSMYYFSCKRKTNLSRKKRKGNTSITVWSVVSNVSKLVFSTLNSCRLLLTFAKELKLSLLLTHHVSRGRWISYQKLYLFFFFIFRHRCSCAFRPLARSALVCFLILFFLVKDKHIRQTIFNIQNH